MIDYIELGKRLRACKHFRWTSGMRAVGRRNLPSAWFRVEEDRKVFVGEWSEAIPDLSDPATRGCVLQLIREAWGDSEAHLALGAAGWSLMSGESRIADVVYPSPPSKDEAEAMVAAMAAAP